MQAVTVSVCNEQRATTDFEGLFDRPAHTFYGFNICIQNPYVEA